MQVKDVKEVVSQVVRIAIFLSRALYPIREDSLDEFLLNLPRSKNGQLQYCVLCEKRIYSPTDHYRLHFPGSLRRCKSCDQAFTTQYHLTFNNASTPPVGVRIHDAILVFNILWLEGHLEPNCHFVCLNIL
jgi:hypothetical protein